MKKRRELDALVNGKSSRGRNAKKSQELLLENMSDSSEIEEFSIPGNIGTNTARKRGFLHFCKSCLTVCSFFMLLSCAVSIVVLVFAYNDLKSEIEEDQKKMTKLPSKVEDLIGSMDIISKNLSDLTTKFATIELAVTKNNKDSPEMKDLTESVNKLQQSFATMGSNLEGVMSDVKTLKDSQVSITHTTTTQKIDMEKLSNMTRSLKIRLDLLELRPYQGTTVPSPDMHDILQQAMSSMNEEIRNYTVSSVQVQLDDISGRLSVLESNLVQSFSTTPGSSDSQFIASFKDFMGTASNNFIFLNDSLQTLSERLTTVEQSLKAQEVKAVKLQNVTRFLQQRTQSLMYDVKSIVESTTTVKPSGGNGGVVGATTTTTVAGDRSTENGDSGGVRSQKQSSLRSESTTTKATARSTSQIKQESNIADKISSTTTKLPQAPVATSTVTRAEQSKAENSDSQDSSIVNGLNEGPLKGKGKG